MERQLNHKGMTLIEIIVVLTISSIIMIVVGTVIVSSFTSFNKTAEADDYKRSMDGISNVVRDELMYASKVTLDTPTPSNNKTLQEDGWKWFSIDEFGHLCHNDETTIDKPLFNRDYYRNLRLGFSVKIYPNNYRVDLKFELLNNDEKKVYGTSYTLELINMKHATTEEDTNHVFSSYRPITTSDKLYYKEEGNVIIEDEQPLPNPDPSGNGTVADEIKCLDKEVTKPGEAGNNKGEFDPNVKYEEGDFIIYNNKYYRLFGVDSNDTGVPPDSANENWWKEIDAEWNVNTLYAYKDIIIHNGKYWQVVDINGTIFEPNLTNWAAWRGPFDSVKLLLDDKYPNTIKPIDMTPTYFSCTINSNYNGTVDKKEDHIDDTVEMWKNGHGAEGDFVYHPDRNSLWLSLDSGGGNQEPGVPKTGEFKWQLIQLDWSPISAYRHNYKVPNSQRVVPDVIRYHEKFYQATREHFESNPKTPDMLDGWVEVMYKNDVWVNVQ